MKKTNKIVALVIAVVMVFAMMTVLLTACGSKDTITIWVSETEGVAELTDEQVKAFQKANPDLYDWNSIKIKVQGQPEGDAASTMIADIKHGAEIYCFAQDQLARLVEAKALVEITGDTKTAISSRNDGGSVKAGSVAGKLYAMPITSDNGFFMYYNKDIVKAEHLDDLAAIVADCEAAKKTFNFELENAWYNAAFFFGAGCELKFTTDEDGKFTGSADTYNSAAGITAMKAMQVLVKSDAYASASAASALGEGGSAAVVVSGTWDATAAKEALGDKLGAAKLPKVTVGDTTFQLGSFSGNKLMGVKPNEDKEREAMLVKLADYLSGEEAQVARFNSFGWGPSNLKAQAIDAVKNDAILTAFAAQNNFAIPQGNIHGSWWDVAKVLGKAAKDAGNDGDLQNALNKYDEDLARLIKLSPEEQHAWTVIGQIGGSSWDTDYKMTLVSSDKDAKTETWKSDKSFELTKYVQWSATPTAADGVSFKVRQGQCWDFSFGRDGDNFDVQEGEEGTKYIQVVITYGEVDSDGNFNKPVSAVITLVD